MSRAVYRVGLRDGTERLAAGSVDGGPEALLAAELTIDAILGEHGPGLGDAASSAGGPVPPGARVLAPVGAQEIWAAGVTYLRSRDARVEEAVEPSPYDRVYEAERPELFHKAAGWRARGPGSTIAVRADSTWDVPEPELTLVLDATTRITGYTIGDDVSSRSIEGANTLYLPQAKTYDGSCAIGPALVPVSAARPPFTIHMSIRRHGAVVYDDETSTDRMARTFDELVAALGSALSFPVGVLLMTGTGLVPDPPFTLQPEDVVTIAVEGLGTLENRVVRLGTR